MLQQGLDDWVAAGEAMPGKRIPDQHSLKIPSAAAPQFPLDILPLSNYFLWINFQKWKDCIQGKDSTVNIDKSWLQHSETQDVSWLVMLTNQPNTLHNTIEPLEVITTKNTVTVQGQDMLIIWKEKT